MMTLLVVVLMILSALVIALPGMQGREYGMNPAATSSANIQPDPTLNTNITWSNFHNGWSPLEYSNGTTNLSLNAQASNYYANPISVNPLDIQSNQLYNTSIYYNNASYWVTSSSATFGSALTQHIATSTKINGHPVLLLQTNGTSAASEAWIPYFSIPFSKYPSNNIAYDYLTVILNMSSGFTTSGQSAFLQIENTTGTDTGSYVGINVSNNEVSTSGETTLNPGSQVEFSTPLSALHGLNWNSTKSNGLTVQIAIKVPQIQTSTYETITVDSIQMTENPLYLGTSQVNGTQHTMEDFNGNAKLTNLDPNFQWTSIVNGGYTAAVSQAMGNLTEQQSAINTASYIEQVEYQGQFELPTAPDLSYGPANLTEHFNVSTSQTQVLDINGVSYLSTISGKNNTVLLLSSASPNGQTQFLQIVDYTQSQWTSISSPPGIFTLAGIEYYWEEFILAVLAIVGVGAGAASRHASNLRKVK